MPEQNVPPAQTTEQREITLQKDAWTEVEFSSLKQICSVSPQISLEVKNFVSETDTVTFEVSNTDEVDFRSRRMSLRQREFSSINIVITYKDFG